jgi:hypothetical protein
LAKSDGVFPSAYALELLQLCLLNVLQDVLLLASIRLQATLHAIRYTRYGKQISIALMPTFFGGKDTRAIFVNEVEGDLHDVAE